MPELPEVESLRRSLEPLVVGRRVMRAEVLRADVVTVEGGGAATPRGLLEGLRIVGTARRGKQLVLIAEGGRGVLVHLGMSGQVLHGRGETPAEVRTHVHARWVLDDGSTMIFRDPRRFGGLWTVERVDDLERGLWRELGPDALSIADEALAERAAGSARWVKAVLLDQAVLAGVGNIYADEALFQAGVRPRRRAERVTRPEWGAIAGAVRRVLQEAVARGGSSLRDYVDATGQTGTAQGVHQVYGRGGEACLRCGGTLRVCVVTQRTTVFCSRCQR